MSGPQWRTVCQLRGVPDDAPLGVKVAGQRLVVVRSSPDSVSVFDDACPHEGYPLSKGTLVDGELVCPWHNFALWLGHHGLGARLRFDLRDGPFEDAIERTLVNLYAPFGGFGRGPPGQVSDFVDGVR